MYLLAYIIVYTAIVLFIRNFSLIIFVKVLLPLLLFFLFSAFKKKKRSTLWQLNAVYFYNIFPVLSFFVASHNLTAEYVIAVPLLTIILFCFFKKRALLITTLFISFHMVLCVIWLGILPHIINTPAFAWSLKTTYAGKKVSDIPGLTKIFYLLDKSLPAEQKYTYYDPYKIIFLNKKAIVVTHELVRKTILYSLESKEPTTINKGCTNYGFYSPDKNIVYVGDTFVVAKDSSYTTIQLPSLAQKKYMLPYKDKPFSTYLHDGFKGGAAFNNKIYLFTFKGRFFEIDQQTHNILKQRYLSDQFKIISPAISYFYGTFNPMANKAYLSTWYMIQSIDLHSFKTLKTKLLPSIKIKYNKQTNQLLALDPIFGYIHILDPDTLKIKRRIKIPRGCKEFHFTPDLSYFFTSTFYKGTFYIYNGNGKCLKSFYIGPLVRAITYAPETKNIYIGSSLGIFSYDLSTLKKNNK